MRNQWVLWGQHIDEYREMFDLSTSDLDGRLLEYGCGPSAVNVELKQLGRVICSCDPLFELNPSVLSTTVYQNFEKRVLHAKQFGAMFDVSRYGGFDAWVEKRRQGLADFFTDYEQGLIEQRYCSMPGCTLPFSNFSFDIAVSSHYLFADPDPEAVQWHMSTLFELARVAKEVRVYPLSDEGQVSAVLGPVLLALQHANYGTEVRPVNYPGEASGDAMLRVWAQQCSLE